MKYLVIKTVMVGKQAVTVDHDFDKLSDAAYYIAECCNETGIINVTINYIKDERTNQTVD